MVLNRVDLIGIENSIRDTSASNGENAKVRDGNSLKMMRIDWFLYFLRWIKYVHDHVYVNAMRNWFTLISRARDRERCGCVGALWFPSGDLRLVRHFYTKLGCNAGFVDSGEKKFDECCATCNHIRINYGRLKILSLSRFLSLRCSAPLCVCVWMCVWWHRAACNWNFCHAKSPISFYH